MSENTIKVNDLPEDNQAAKEEVELPVIDNKKSEEERGGHSEGGCCGVCGG